MEVHNRDVFPTQDVQDVYNLVEPILVNSIIDDRFLEHEKAATKAKTHYHQRGRLAMLFVLLSALFTIAGALVIPVFPGLELLSIVFTVLGAIGLAIQIHLLVTKKKQRWLLHRFAAERLRSIKFQAYPLIGVTTSTVELAQKANSFYSMEVARLNMELNAGDAALVLFSPANAVTRTPVPAAAAPRNAAIETMGRNAYRELRIAYQRRFATAEIQALQQHRRIGYTAADILYLLGALLTVAALTCKLVFPNVVTASNWIDFVAVAAFILGLFTTIMDNASLAETSKARYEDYARELEECDKELTAESASFPEVVRRIERVVLEELNHFCQSAAQISYRL
jgi:hypothetical protein